MKRKRSQLYTKTITSINFAFAFDFMDRGFLETESLLFLLVILLTFRTKLALVANFFREKNTISNRY